jgi:hypothetical protein
MKIDFSVRKFLCLRKQKQLSKPQKTKKAGKTCSSQYLQVERQTIRETKEADR